RRRWFILALRERDPEAPYVAFFPLRLITHLNEKTGLFYDEIIMAGNFAADYTGFIVSPVLMFEKRSKAGNGVMLVIRSDNEDSV
ncbi:cellulose biosynthesis protein, partial [Rhizobium leguminosarum]